MIVRYKLYLQSLLTSLCTFEVTHSRFVTHFKIQEIQNIKILIFLLLHKLGSLYIFNLKYVLKCQLTSLYL